ncbi:thermonuclease family protein [Sphingomonas sp. ID1715]|uniref:thermonuclease family protein n=1 Tax=Sphingomonas sp. ID1715 TaxID=1656898 RepID=UPI001583555A|nr:thermonuclease family protein [Sphingomonas sp. ID1715]
MSKLSIFSIMIAGAIATSTAAWSFRPDAAGPSYQFTCAKPRIVDGDTLRCGPVRVRLAHIDAPELPGHCNPGRQCAPGDPFASLANLQRLVGSSPLECGSIDRDRYGREVAFCSEHGRDLSCAQVSGGFAVKRYGALSCWEQRRGSGEDLNRPLLSSMA